MQLRFLRDILFPEKKRDNKRSFGSVAEPKSFHFDWDSATVGPFGGNYYQDIDYYCSVGQDGWMPVGSAMCSMQLWWYADNERSDAYYDSGKKTLVRFLVNRMHLDPQDGRIDKWLKSNEAVFQNFGGIGANRQTEITVPEGYLFPKVLELSGMSLAEIYLASVERVYPPAFNRRMVLADGLSPAYWEHPTVQNAIEGAKATLELTTELALTWFEARGIAVNRDKQLVRADGFTAISDFVEDFF